MLGLIAGASAAPFAPCQGPYASTLLRLEASTRELESRLGSRDPSEWRVAWDQVEEIGPAAGAALWERLPRDRKPLRRLVRLAGFVVAAGVDGQSTVLDRDWLLAPRSKKHEQLIAFLALALEARRDAAAPALYTLASKSPSTAVRIAACAALSRGPAVEPLPGGWFAGTRGQSADAGLCAAALLCGAGPPPQMLAACLTTPDVPSREDQLVWRALFVTPHHGARDESRRLVLAKRAMQWSDASTSAVRRAAAVCAARVEEPGAALPRTDAPAGDLLVCLVHTARGRAAALERGWLRPVPSTLFRAAERRQLVAAFALAATPAEVTGSFARWEEEPELLDAAILALAWRVLQQPGAWSAGRWLDSAKGRRAAAWLRVALGESVADEVLADRDAHPALVFGVAGRLPPAVMAREVERELWRAGAHPGAPAWRTWTSLVRDLVLSGSDYASAKAATAEIFPYLPRDLPRGDERFFEPAVEFVDWREATRDVVPAEVRLRRT